MKQLNNFIQEKLKLDKDYKEPEKTYKEEVQEVTNLAKEKGLTIVFRDRTTNTGDFCFFIYDKKKQKRYLVGYDGNWKASNTTGDYDFEHCLNQTIKYIENYK